MRVIKYYIYLLRCPDTNMVRYVGCTRFPHIRQREHCLHAIKNPKTLLQHWLVELRKQNKQPTFEIVEVSQRGQFGAEQEWIHHFQAEGHPLLNVRLVIK